jgi:cardiolipin synthase
VFAARHIPNLITLVRIALVVPIALALAYHQLMTAVTLFGCAALSDAADGYLAKRFGWRSELGAVLDPIADKLLLATAFITLAVLRWVPLWLMATAVARDAIIVGGAASYRFLVGPLTALPTVVSKFNTLCQAAFILAVVAAAAFGWPAPWVATMLGALVFVTTVVSGIDYVLVYARRAVRARGQVS